MIDHFFVDKKLIWKLVFISAFVKAVTEIRDTLYAIWQKISMPYKLSGKTKFSMASFIV